MISIHDFSSKTVTMNPKSNEISLHVVFLPYMAPGHMMPMFDMARLFATHGVQATIITTPANAALFHHSLHPLITLLTLPLSDSSLPDGCENLISAPTPQTTIQLIRAIDNLHPQIETLILNSKPDCIVSDVLYPWTVDVAATLRIPRIAFSGSCFFSDCVAKCVKRHAPHAAIVSESEEFVVPTLPDRVVLTRSQLPDIVKTKTEFSELFERLREAEERSFGVLMNTFYELESNYADFFRKDLGGKAWHVGPLSLCNRHGNHNVNTCISWLDSMEVGSVVYVCFGSLTRFSKAQIVEMAGALEASESPFVWVIGRLVVSEDGNGNGNGEEWWLPEGFEERMRESNKGHIVRGWAPQVLILEHEAVGGFLTHCGWNSILEGVCAGVPFITWPVFAEQFYNEKLVTQVLRVGVGVGNVQWKVWATEEGVVVEEAKIREVIRRVMGDAGESESMRKKARELSVLAKASVEDGGSSYNNFTALIEEIKSFAV